MTAGNLDKHQKLNPHNHSPLKSRVLSITSLEMSSTQAKLQKSAIASGLKKLNEAWDEGDHYTVQQVYKTLYARFVI